MRRLALLLALLLLSTLGAAAAAPASLLPLANQAQPLFAVEEEEGPDELAEEAEIEREICEEDPEICEEEAPAPKQDRREGCVLKSARAALIASPGKRRLRLTVHYEALQPATVSVAASLQGARGTVRLGADHARFRRTGVYRHSYELTEKQIKKAAAARRFSVQLNVVNAPASCRIELTGPSRPAKRQLRAGAPGRSGDRGPTHGR